jgi:hypothetical protein
MKTNANLFRQFPERAERADPTAGNSEDVNRRISSMREKWEFGDREAIMGIWTDARAELFLGFYVIAWVVALVLTRMLQS